MHNAISRTIASPLDFSQGVVLVTLVRDSHLVSANDEIFILLVELRNANEVRRLHARVPKKAGIGDLVDELLRWDGFPEG